MDFVVRGRGIIFRWLDCVPPGEGLERLRGRAIEDMGKI
jgi:hypothetical protein